MRSGASSDRGEKEVNKLIEGTLSKAAESKLVKEPRGILLPNRRKTALMATL